MSCNTQRTGMAHPPNTEQGHICIKCGGEFLIGLSEPGVVHVDYVYVQPGAAGRFVRKRPSLLLSSSLGVPLLLGRATGSTDSAGGRGRGRS